MQYLWPNHKNNVNQVCTVRNDQATINQQLEANEFQKNKKSNL